MVVPSQVSLSQMEVWRHTEVGYVCATARSRVNGEETPQSLPRGGVLNF